MSGCSFKRVRKILRTATISFVMKILYIRQVCFLVRSVSDMNCGAISP